MEETKNEKTLELAQRTRKNLEFIYSAKHKGEDVEEFTQLLNSMLSMVISLREDYFKGDHITWKDVQNLELKSWNPDLRINGENASIKSPNLQKTNTFSQLITKLRHAFAHNCYDLIIEKKEGEEKGQITGIRVWNLPAGKRDSEVERVWEAEIYEKELKGLAYLFLEYIEKQLGDESDE